MLALAALPARLQAEQCPRRFDELTTGLPSACVFVGRYNPRCGEQIVALFAGDGRALVVSFAGSGAQRPLFIPAHVMSPTEGKLVSWSADLQLDSAPSMGSVRLEDGGQRLRVRIGPGTLSADGCAFEEFVGQFAGMAAAGPGSPPSNAIAAAQ